MNGFDVFYSLDSYYFGVRPSSYLVKYIEKYDIKPCEAIDIGAGEGRDSFFLASLGFDVTAIEPNQYGTQKIKNGAIERNLDIAIINNDFLSVSGRLSNIGLLIAFTSLDHMEYDYMIRSVSEIKRLLKKGGYVFINVYSINDPGYRGDSESNCFRMVKHYFQRNELRDIFNDFLILEYEIRNFIDGSHGPKHNHEFISMLAIKE